MAIEPADPAAQVAALEAQAQRYETPCGDGVIVWRRWGSGPPLLLAHGAQGSWTHWFRNIPALAAERSLWLPDLPGYGDSALPPGGGRQGIADALGHGIRQLLGNAVPVDAVAFSFGAIAFAYVDAAHPGLLRRLILVDAGGIGTPHGHFELKPMRGLEGEARQAVLRANLLSFMLHDPASVDALTLYLQATNVAKGRKGLDVAPLVLPDKLLLTLPHLSAQVDAIWGEHDAPHPDPAVQQAALRGVVPDMDFRVLEGAGHWAMFERPEAFNRTVLEMLATPLRRAS